VFLFMLNNFYRLIACLETLKSFVTFVSMGELTSIKNILHQLKPELTEKYHVQSIGLFGSIVRDDFSPMTSDIDIIVDFSQPIGIEFIDLADLIERRLKYKIDLVSKNGIKKKYYSEIEPEIIYI
jgi:predicted nucleotidyltransferase